MNPSMQRALPTCILAAAILATGSSTALSNKEGTTMSHKQLSRDWPAVLDEYCLLLWLILCQLEPDCLHHT